MDIALAIAAVAVLFVVGRPSSSTSAPIDVTPMLAEARARKARR